MNYIFLFAFSITFAFIAKSLKMPGSLLVGSLFGSAFFTLLIKETTLPLTLKFIAQTITGSFIGSTIKKNDIIGLRKIFKPICLSLSSMVLGMLLSGSILYFIFNFDLPTALLSAVPGGIADVTLMSIDYNANIDTVALIQTTRLFVVIVVLPNIIQYRFKDIKPVFPVEKEREEIKTNHSIKNLLITLSIGFIFARVSKMLHVPAGPLSFSMISIILFNYLTNAAYVPIQFKSVAQIISGTLVGITVTKKTLLQIPQLFLPIFIVISFYLVFNSLISLIISKTTTMDQATAMFATAPAGASDMVLIAADMDMNVNKTEIVLMHLARLISVVTVFPLLISIIIYLC